MYPSVETLRALLVPLETQVFVGNQVSRTKGDGIEFADIRAWAPGDRTRRINWRATARRGELWVNEQSPERNTDVVLFLDTFTDAQSGGRGTLDLSVICAGTATGATGTPPSCVTPLQALAMNKLWYGQTRDGTAPPRAFALVMSAIAEKGKTK